MSIIGAELLVAFDCIRCCSRYCSADPRVELRAPDGAHPSIKDHAGFCVGDFTAAAAERCRRNINRALMAAL